MLYGVAIKSGFRFRNRLIPTTAPPDLTFTRAVAPPETPAPGTLAWDSRSTSAGCPAVYFWRINGGFVLRFEDVSSFTVGPDRIECRTGRATDDCLVELQFLGLVLALWLEERGRTVLHASAVESSGWDIKKAEPTAPATANPFSLSQGNLDGATLAGAVGFASYVLSHPVPVAPEELQAWADARMMRSRMSMIRGRVASRGFAPAKLLDVMEIDGVGARFNGTTLVTGICHRVDVDGWRTDIQFGLSPRSFCLENDIRDVPAAGLIPAVGGLQIGVVDKFEADPDKELRVKVILPGIDAKTGSVWARLTAPDAGNNRGYFFRPEKGDEVVVGFFNEDPRQPVILGALYSSKNAPASDYSVTQDNLKKGIVTKAGTKILFNDDNKASLSLETASQNKILLDDDKELVSITDKHGNTITMDKDGIKLESGKDLKLTASGNVEIKGAKVDVK